MGQIGNSFISNIEIKGLTDQLCAFYAFEKEKAWIAEVAETRLFGQSELLLKEVFQKVKSDADKFADDLAKRVFVLGRDLTWDRKRIVDLNPIPMDNIPDPNNFREFSECFMNIIRDALKMYYSFLVEIKDKDFITYHLLRPIVEYYVELEDELEQILEFTDN